MSGPLNKKQVGIESVKHEATKCSGKVIVSNLQSDISQTAFQTVRRLLVCETFSVLDTGKVLLLVKCNTNNPPITIVNDRY